MINNKSAYALNYGNGAKNPEEEEKKNENVQAVSPYGEYLSGGKTPQVSSYADYLSGGSAASGFSKWLEVQEQNKKSENTPAGAMSYAEYLSYTGGTSAAEQYRQEVKSAYADYLTGKVTYGQNAEKLAQSGLSGSGYGDYLAGMNYAARQNAVSAAKGNAVQRIDANARNYAEYLSGVKQENAQNEQNAYNSIVQQGLTGDAAKQYALGLGLTEEQASSVVSRTDGVLKQSLTDNAYNQIAAAVSEGSSFEGAVAALNGTVSQEILEAAKKKYMEVNKANISGVIGSMTSAGKDVIDAISSDVTLTEEERGAKVAEAQAKNAELLNKALQEDYSGIMEYARSKGVDLSGDTVNEDGTVAQKLEKKIENVVDSMYNEGLISKVQVQNFYFERENQNILGEGLENSTKVAVNEIEIAYNLLKSDRISEAQYKELLKAINQGLVTFAGGVSVEKAYTTAQIKGMDGRRVVKIKYSQGANKHESINIDLDELMNVNARTSGDNFVEGNSVTVDGNSTLTFGTINGRVAYRITDKDGNQTYHQTKSGTPEYLNTFDNAGFIAYMCTARS